MPVFLIKALLKVDMELNPDIYAMASIVRFFSSFFNKGMTDFLYSQTVDIIIKGSVEYMTEIITDICPVCVD